MGKIERTERAPNFHKDVRESKFAEKDFENMFYSNPKNQGKTLFDVTDVPQYRVIDVDYIIDNEGGNELGTLYDVLTNKKRYVKVEVKANGCALSTGRYAFEFNSHGKLGWGIVTQCDLIYTVLVQKNTSNIIRRAWIKMPEWKRYVTDSNNRDAMCINHILNENVTDVLCQMSDMERKGVLLYIDK